MGRATGTGYDYGIAVGMGTFAELEQFFGSTVCGDDIDIDLDTEFLHYINGILHDGHIAGTAHYYGDFVHRT